MSRKSIAIRDLLAFRLQLYQVSTLLKLPRTASWKKIFTNSLKYTTEVAVKQTIIPWKTTL